MTVFVYEILDDSVPMDRTLRDDGAIIASKMSSAQITNPLSAAEERYRKDREEIHRKTVMTFRQSLQHLQITSITTRALESLSSTWNCGLRTVDWDWGYQQRVWRKRRPSYWEMAIWHKQTLCGLVLGGPSRRRSRLYVEGIEGNPSTTPLKTHIIPIALIGSEMYASSIGCKEVWLVDPAEGLLDRYVKAGYTIKSPNKFLAKVLRQKRFAVKAVGA